MSQPNPKVNNSTPIVELVFQDLEARKQKGLETYGTLLQANNGREALWDAYEEALDLAMYLRQAIEEARQVDSLNVGNIVRVSTTSSNLNGNLGTVQEVKGYGASVLINGTVYWFSTSELQKLRT